MGAPRAALPPPGPSGLVKIGARLHLQTDVLAELDGWAERKGLSRAAAVRVLLEHGLAVQRHAEAAAVRAVAAAAR